MLAYLRFHPEVAQINRHVLQRAIDEKAAREIDVSFIENRQLVLNTKARFYADKS